MACRLDWRVLSLSVAADRGSSVRGTNTMLYISLAFTVTRMQAGIAKFAGPQ